MPFSPLAQAILEVLKASDRPMNTLEIARRVDVDNQTASSRLRNLARAGLVRRVGYTPTVRAVVLWECVRGLHMGRGCLSSSTSVSPAAHPNPRC